MKKFLTSILIILLMFNFIFCNCIVYAVPPSGEGGEIEQTQTQKSYTDPVDESNLNGTVGAEVEEASTNDGDSSKALTMVGFILGILSRMINYIAVQVDILISHLANNPSKGDIDADEMFWFSIDKAVFNRVALFNINFFNTDSTYKVGDKEITADSNNIKIKESITKSYYICRILSLAISVVILIYIGIRMAISTVASDQAKYKKMLMSWVESIVILFAMPYIMSVFFALGESVTGIFSDIRNGLLGQAVPGSAAGTYGVFEETIRKKIFGVIYDYSGLNLALWSLIYWALLFNELKFLWLYLKRVLIVGFLIIISPIITITYSIDKVGDGKAQAFSIWMKEFILNVLIQPLHALLYLVFIFSANSIAATSPLVGVALLFAMGQAERMVKVVFDMKGSVTLRGVNKFMKKEG